jgi:tetratricopeptide (TPR) repeat protein
MSNETKLDGDENIVIPGASHSTINVTVNKSNTDKKSSYLPKGLINVSNAGRTFFTEQGTVLEDLETQLRSRHIACLHGKHGLGKTTNAQEFSRRQVGNYELVVFLNAAEKILETSIINFADDNIPELKSLSLFERQKIAPEAKLALFQTFFNDNELWQGEKRGWLLIFDNLESKEQIRKYFPDTNNGDILYTCNDDLYLDVKCEVPISEFSQTEAELFLYKRNIGLKDAKHEEIPAEDLADIRKILNDYGRLPFVVNKFRAYLSEIPISYAAFYQELKNNEQIYFEREASTDLYQYKNEIIAFSTSFEKIKPQENQSNDDQLISRLAVALLEISAFCFPDQIPEEILRGTLFRIVETTKTTLSNEILFAETFRKLQRFDLLNSKNEIFEYLEKKETPEVIYAPFQKEETVYQSHRTIQKIIKLNLETEAKKEILNEIIAVLRYLTPKPKLEKWKIFEKYLSNAENLIEEARKLELTTENLGYICNEFGVYQDNLAQYEKAIQFYKESLRIGEKTIGKEHPDYATYLNNLASIYQSQGKYDEAFKKYEESIAIIAKTVSKNHPSYAIRLNNLGETYRLQGKYDKAIEKFEEALRIGEKTIGKEHPDYATRLNNLAVVYDSQSRYDEAIEKHQQALKIRELILGKSHPDYAQSLNNLANVYENQGKYKKALELYKDALEILERTLPKNHPNILIIRKNAARCRMISEK